MRLRIGCGLVGFLALVVSLAAQTASGSPTSSQVPPLIQLSNVASDEGGNSLSGVVSITFSLYAGQRGGQPLWIETQNNVQLDATGHYSVQLGITKPNGVPTTLFTTGEARWLGVRIAEQAEQPRVLLLSVPYALKAGDAATIGGLPPSAFVLAAPLSGAAPVSATDPATGPGAPPPSGDVTGTGKVNYLPLWDTTSDIISSVVFQKGTGSTARIGINTITPATTLDVKGGGTIRGTLSLPATAAATATAGKNSQALNLAASAFNSTSSTAVNQTFQWQSEPAGNDTSTPSGTLNLLFGEGATKPSETGLNIASNGQITFATGQTFPGTGTGDGTVTSVATGLGLTGGPIIASGTLTIDTAVVPQLKTANTFSGNQTVNGNLTATNITATQTVSGGVVNATTSFDIQGGAFAFGSYGNDSAFLGFAGNSTMTGSGNTASGPYALASNTTGSYNVAVGPSALGSNTTGLSNTASGIYALFLNTTGGSNTASGNQALYSNTTANGNTASGNQALYSNTTGASNTAAGGGALFSNTTGSHNTASGIQALYSNTTGYENTAVGGEALFSNTTGNDLTCIGYFCSASEDGLSNATAIGAHAVVSTSNALVLGGTGAYAVKVGIGTATPSSVLTIAQGAGHPVSDGWETFSSRRWKTNIQTLHGALGKVEQMRGVSYDLKANGKHEVGVIAEEVGAVIPELVSYEENGKDARSVDYSRLTALLIEATKEQQIAFCKEQAELAKALRQIRQQQSLLRAQSSGMRSLQAEVRETRESLLKVKAQVAATQPMLVAAK
ncbi:MAG: tail fiber domain-containing protein [Terriglobales bacterium]